MASTGTEFTSETWHFCSKQGITLSHTHSPLLSVSYTHITLSISFDCLSPTSPFDWPSLSASLSCMRLYRSECLFCFMSGFPLDPLCTPIRFVTQLLWMGLRDRRRGKEGGKEWGREGGLWGRGKEMGRAEMESYSEWVGLGAAFKHIGRKEECEPGQ